MVCAPVFKHFPGVWSSGTTEDLAAHCHGHPGEREKVAQAELLPVKWLLPLRLPQEHRDFRPLSP